MGHVVGGGAGAGDRSPARARHLRLVVAVLVAVLVAAVGCVRSDDGAHPSPSVTDGTHPSPSVTDDHDDATPPTDRTPGWSTADLDEPSPLPGWMAAPRPDPDACPAPTVRVGDAEGLRAALAESGPGTSIWLEPGEYEGRFEVTGAGRPDDRVYLCGPARAVLDGGDQTSGYVLHLDGARYWTVHGFTVRNGQKGVMVDAGDHVTVSGLTVYGIGDEAVHLRSGTVDSTVADNVISDTGRRRAKLGEGIYVGTATSNWCRVSDCEPDRSDRATVTGNVVHSTPAEAVDVKEGTTGGLLADNHFDGSALTAADSWVAVKGNDWVVRGNVGRYSPDDGFQAQELVDGWGRGNFFTRNSGRLGGPDAVAEGGSGGGLLVALDPVVDNVVRCDNRLLGRVGALTNTDCDG